MVKNRTLSTAFNTNDEELDNQTSQNAPETSQEAHTEVLGDSEGNPSLTVKEVKERLLNKFEEKSNKKTVEDTHTRTTFLFRNDLAKRLDKLAKNKRGFKTMFLNEAIESLLNEWENDNR